MKTSANTATNAASSKSNFRSRIMKYAWQIWRATKTEWRVCMKKAWQLYYLAKRLRQGVHQFAYVKADGTVRTANGTLRDFPAGATLNGKKVTKPSYKTFAYFDVDKKSFRCFKIENLIVPA